MYKMNELVNKFLSAGDKFMPKKHLRQPTFTYSTIVTCFQHDLAYGDFKDFPRRTTSDKVFSDKASFDITKIQIMMDVIEVLLPWFKSI